MKTNKQKADNGAMLTAHEATLDSRGVVKFKETIHVDSSRKVLVVFLDEVDVHNNEALLSEASLAKDWLDPAEDIAWNHFQKNR